MSIATITTKGQVTIPKQIREHLKLKAGDKIEITATGENNAVIRPVSKQVEDVYCKLHNPAQKVISPAAMRSAITIRMKRKLNESYRH